MKTFYDKYKITNDYRISHKLYWSRKLFYFKTTKRKYYFKIHVILAGFTYEYESCYWKYLDWPLYND